jgi:hypothetical protein
MRDAPAAPAPARQNLMTAFTPAAIAVSTSGLPPGFTITCTPG